MSVEAVGDITLSVAGIGVVVMATLFLVSVRWWTDLLGRVLASVLFSAGMILALVVARALGMPLPGIHWWRVFLYGTFGLAVWTGVGAFVWSQFFASRRRVPSTPEHPSSVKEETA